MDDMISRQAAIDAFVRDIKVLSATDYDFGMKKGFLYRAIQKIKDLPSAQQNKTCEFWDGESNYCALNRPSAQDVIRCKNCKWYDLRSPFGTVVADAFYCKVNDKFYEDSHYCGYGERRE